MGQAGRFTYKRGGTLSGAFTHVQSMVLGVRQRQRLGCHAAPRKSVEWETRSLQSAGRAGPRARMKGSPGGSSGLMLWQGGAPQPAAQGMQPCLPADTEGLTPAHAACRASSSRTQSPL